jgi:hypothetical protein
VVTLSATGIKHRNRATIAVFIPSGLLLDDPRQNRDQSFRNGADCKSVVSEPARSATANH